MDTRIDELDRLAERARRYARYSRSAGGLSSVIGGVLLVVSFACNAFVELGPVLRAGLAATPALWLLSKELLKHRYYQREGLALQAPTRSERRQHRWMVAYLSLFTLCIVAVMVAATVRDGHPPGFQMIGYTLILVALPFVAWRWFWSVSDFLVGVLLFCQSAVVIAGSNYPPIWLLYVGACAAIAVIYGWREHREYLALRAELATGDGGR